MTEATQPVNSPHPLNYVRLYTDGACRGNPGPGGWAYVLKHPASGKEREDAPSAVTLTWRVVRFSSLMPSRDSSCWISVVTDAFGIYQRFRGAREAIGLDDSNENLMASKRSIVQDLEQSFRPLQLFLVFVSE